MGGAKRYPSCSENGGCWVSRRAQPNLGGVNCARQANQSVRQNPVKQIISEFQKFRLTPDPNHFYIPHCPVPQRGVAQRHQRGAGCGGRGSAFDEWRCSVRPSRVVLTPRCWRQVCDKKRRRRCQTSLVTGEITKYAVKPLRGECRVVPV